MNKPVIFGATVGVLSLLLLFYMIKPNKPAEAQQYKSNFEVVDTYNGCAVVRYAAPTEAKYHYFLDCEK